MIQYAVEECSKCGKDNRIYLGNPDDITGFDPDSFKCFACGEITPLYEESECRDVEDGRPVQSEKERLDAAREEGRVEERKRLMGLVWSEIAATSGEGYKALRKLRDRLEGGK